MGVHRTRARQLYRTYSLIDPYKYRSCADVSRVYQFADADRYVDYATSNGIQIHCHNLVWHSQLPPWVTNGNFSRSELIEVMHDHIKGLAGRYKGRCTRWDVVNEGIIPPS